MAFVVLFFQNKVWCAADNRNQSQDLRLLMINDCNIEQIPINMFTNLAHRSVLFARGKITDQLKPAASFATSQKVNFKFKLTDELIKEHEEKERSKPQKPVPEPALHTKFSSLIMARVSSERYNKVIKVAVTKHRLNETFLLYVREQDNIQVYDENDECNPGDWILLRRLEEPLDGIEHKVERVVYTYGKYIDPLTGRRSLGIYYEDDYERLEKIKLDL